MVFYFLFIFFNFIGVWLLYIVLVSAVQQSRKLCIYPLPSFFGFPSRLGHHGVLSRVPWAMQ